MSEENNIEINDFIKELQREHTDNEIKCRIRKLEADIANDKESLKQWFELKGQETQAYRKTCFLTNVFNFLSTLAIIMLLFTMTERLL